MQASNLYRYVRLILISLALVSIVVPATTTRADGPPLRHVLFLNSYHQTMGWSQKILAAINDELEPDKHNIVLDIINMDTKNTFSAEYIKETATFLKIKTKGIQHELIIASDNNAYDFLKQHRHSLFPNVPVVFCSVNDLNLEEAHKLIGYTGVEEIFNAPKTLDLALRLHPETKEVLIVNDNLTSGRAVANEIKLQLGDKYKNINISYTGAGPIEQVNAQLRALPADSIVLIGAYYTDQTHRHIAGYEQMGPHLVEGVTVPVYTLYDFHIHDGVIGGKVASAYQQGKQAAILAKRILQGENADDIPIIRSGTTEFIFNYPELTKHSIAISKLPSGSLIINQPISTFQTYKKEILTISVFVGLLLIVICLLLININHRRRIAEQLRESELKLKTIFNQTYAFIGLLTPQGKIIDVNQPSLDFCQISKADVVDRHFAETPWWNHSAETQEQLRHNLETAARGQVVNFETIHSANGIPHIFAATISPVFDRTGQVAFLIIEGRDITAQKSAEAEKQKMIEQLRQTQKMEALGTFASGIAHDFNNILSAVLGFTELNLISSECSGTLREHSEHVKSAALRGRGLIQQILTFCRKEETSEELFEIHQVVNEALNMVRNNIPDRITINASIDESTGWILADETQLHQIVMNLCTNASHAIDTAQGEIAVRLERVTVTADTPPVADLVTGNYARLTIADNGKGMTEEVKKKIFDPFFTTKTLGTGTGLGLAIVHGIIKKLKGGIQLDSEPGKGTTFTLWIPLSENKPNKVPVLPKPMTEATNRQHILWVDDEEILVTLGREMIKALNYEVTTTTSANEALALFKKHPGRYHMLITDQTMPEMSGVELSQTLLEINPELPVILCTGDNHTITQETVEKMGIKAFLMKPLHMENLAIEIQKHLPS